MTDEVKTEQPTVAPQERPQTRIYLLVVDLLTKAKPRRFQLGVGGCNLIAETTEGFLVGYSDGSGSIVPRSSIASADFVIVPLEKAVEALSKSEAPKHEFKGDNVISFAEASKKRQK